MQEQTHSSLPPIAIVEDDADLLANMEEYLRMVGFDVWGVPSAEAFYRRYLVSPVDVVILDIGLPGEDGLSVARHLKGLPHLAVIIISGRDQSVDRVAGLRAGADRYLVKPINLEELAANIEAICRRHPARMADEPSPSLSGDRWLLDAQAWQLTAPDGKTLKLTAREFTLVKLLFMAQGQTVGRDAIADSIYGSRILTRNERLDVLVARLRKKAVTAFDRPLPIKTIPQTGYLFSAPAVLDQV